MGNTTTENERKKIMVKTSKIAITTYFDCKTIEDPYAFPKVCITAELIIDRGKIHHVNTDEIKAAIENAVKNAVWYIENKKAQVTGEK